MKLQYRIGTVVASSALVLSMLAPMASASTKVTIAGNGKSSNNTANVTNTNTTSVSQSNNMTVNLNITSNANTGGNKANGNTGGDVSVKTGDAKTVTTVAVIGGVNVANTSGCGCANDTEVNVKDNGKKTDNKSIVTNTNSSSASQGNTALVNGDLKSKAKTGKNKANDNTKGSTEVETGDADTTTEVVVAATANVLNP